MSTKFDDFFCLLLQFVYKIWNDMGQPYMYWEEIFNLSFSQTLMDALAQKLMDEHLGKTTTNVMPHCLVRWRSGTLFLVICEFAAFIKILSVSTSESYLCIKFPIVSRDVAWSF